FARALVHSFSFRISSAPGSTLFPYTTLFRSADLSKIFDRFYQVNGGLGGIGIGLALVKELVNLHGGTITAQSTPGKQTEFQVNLDRKSTRLNSSHVKISYAVFCLKKRRKL